MKKYLSDFELVSKLAEYVDKLSPNHYEFYLDMEEMVSYNQKLSGPRRSKIMYLISDCEGSQPA